MGVFHRTRTDRPADRRAVARHRGNRCASNDCDALIKAKENYCDGEFAGTRGRVNSSRAMRRVPDTAASRDF
jgi:hypothetical protein